MEKNVINETTSPIYREDIILASASPRRREMFEREGIPFEVFPAEVDEELPFEMDPQTAVMYLAFAKAIHVSGKKQGLIIAADTIVVYDGEIIGKPSDEDEAYRVLSAMRGDVHKVMTGVCIIDCAGGSSGEKDGAAKGTKRCLCEVTDVYFKDYSDEELRAYVRTPEPYDKAGGYAIQMTFAKYVDHIDGDRDNVIGFPMYRVLDDLKGTRT